MDRGRGAAPIRALVFDFDGLLVDTETAAYEAWTEVYRNHGHQSAADAA